MHRSLNDNPWVSRTKWLTQALIISGALNIGFVSTFIYFVLKEKQEALGVRAMSNAFSKQAPLSNLSLLRSYFFLPYQELLLHLENSDSVQDGLSKRDLALGCLVAFHHFNLDQALGGLFLQRRILQFTNSEGQETIDIPVFPGLADSQFQAIVHYAKTEKWPFTSQGLFYEIKRQLGSFEPSLLEAFSLSSEYEAVDVLFTKTGLSLTPPEVIALIAEGEWTFLSDLCTQQRLKLDLSPERRRAFLLQYLTHGSKVAAKLFLEYDLEFACRRLSDGQVLTLLDLYAEQTPALENFAKELLAAPRTDAVWKRAASLLYAFSGEAVPEPFSHALVIERFLPSLIPQPPLIQVEAPIVQPTPAIRRMHTVVPGDSLWKIARKYQVSIEEIKRLNHLETERLRLGKQLEIPEKK